MCVLSRLVMSDSFATPWSPPGSSVHEILQAGILEWVAIFFSESKGVYISIVYQLCFLSSKRNKFGLKNRKGIYVMTVE